MKKLFIFLMILVGAFGLTSCGLFDTEETITEITTTNSRVNNDEGNTINGKYYLDAQVIEDYTDISNEDAAVVVAGIVMPATLEIKCTIKFSYLAYSYSPFGGAGSKTQTGSETSQATGFIINEQGYMLTNAHVVTLSDYESYNGFQYVSRDIKVNYADSATTFQASLVDYNANLDLAVLKIDPTQIEGLKYTTFYNITSPEDPEFNTDEAVSLLYGETVVAVGNANGYGISITQGVISAPIRYFDGVSTQAIQTDAAINPGNSGGPLANKFGAVVGINSFKIVTTTTENLGYAIPSNVVINYIDSLNKNIKYYYTNERAYSSSSILSNIA